DYNIKNCKCGNDSGEAETDLIRAGIRYLRHVNGVPQNGPGPGACGRVSCSWKSAIQDGSDASRS
ncbi:hypothetical protein B0T16DRAFT_311408, partial [Cercophora newfieldiana]